MELFEKAGKVRISARWRTPAHMRNLGALISEICGENLKSDVDHARRRVEKIARNLVVLFDHRLLRVNFSAVRTNLTPPLPSIGRMQAGRGARKAAAALIDTEERVRDFGDCHGAIA